MVGDMKKSELPGTLKRSPEKAQETFALHAAQQSALNLLRGKSLGGATA